MGSKLEAALSLTRHRSLQALLVFALLYVALILLYELPLVSRWHPATTTPTAVSSAEALTGGGVILAGGDAILRLRAMETLRKTSPARTHRRLTRGGRPPLSNPNPNPSQLRFVSGLVLRRFNGTEGTVLPGLLESAFREWELGERMLDDALSAPPSPAAKNRTAESCPDSITMTADNLRDLGHLLVIPCGLTLGSHVTVIGRPRKAHKEYDPKISRAKEGDEGVMVSQFMMELRGLRVVDGLDPPRILHFNPRLKGDWSGRPVIEQNTCYRMQWGMALRCDGRKSKPYEETVDGLSKCEKWLGGDDRQWEETKAAWWSNRLMGHTKKTPLDWMYPFVENKLFVLTLSAGLEGYHISVDGRHVTSFPYRPGFVLEDATGLALHGDIDIQSIFAASLPTSHSSFSQHESLEFFPKWKASPLPNGSVDLFIGIISTGSHFAERMAVRKSWMSFLRKSSKMVARFFVALHGRNEVNIELKKEAEFFGDIVILPFMDSYDLVVLKTVAICEYGVRTVSAKYIMKCDDDTFVRIGLVIKILKNVTRDKSLYMGNMNYDHKPLRSGKWAVTYEEWPEEVYPPYANGPGYIISSDIARFVVSGFENHTLDMFKMEDVSMGLWVQQFGRSAVVEYLHSHRFCQFGCINGYFTAHYQSPRQMMCLWDKLKDGIPQCCNMR